MPGPQDPTIAYLVYRGVLVGIVIILLLTTVYLVIQLLLGISEWAT